MLLAVVQVVLFEVQVPQQRSATGVRGWLGITKCAASCC